MATAAMRWSSSPGFLLLADLCKCEPTNTVTKNSLVVTFKKISCCAETLVAAVLITAVTKFVTTPVDHHRPEWLLVPLPRIRAARQLNWAVKIVAT